MYKEIRLKAEEKEAQEAKAEQAEAQKETPNLWNKLLEKLGFKK